MGRFRGRRKGPSKNDKKVRRRENSDRTGSVALENRFPGISGLSLELVVNDERGEALERQSRSFSRGDSCDVAIACPGRCGVGAYDLSRVLSEAIEAGESSRDGSFPCKHPRYGTVSEACGCVLELKASWTSG
jgi:hypothetical protein